MPPKGYRRKIAALADESVVRRHLYIRMRETDWRYLQSRYGTASDGIRELVIADRRAFEDSFFRTK